MNSLERILKSNQGKIGSIVPFSINKEKIFVFDFTENNEELEKINISNVEELDRYVKEAMKSNDASVGIGKYNEDRTIYKRSSLFNTERTIHLGIDVILSAGTKIMSPLDAVVHNFQNNDNFGDYGPTIILQHELDDMKFYTLYGHLSNESLEGKSGGQEIRKGEAIGAIGNIHVNGNWFEHVHFQIIAYMEGRKGDFPGVANIRERERYLKICPNPNLILKIDRLL